MNLSITTDDKNIEECVRTICSVPRGSVPGSRGIGLSWELLDSIPPDVENDMVTDLADQMNRYEARASLNGVEFTVDEDGTLNAEIDIEEVEEDGNS